MTTITISLLGHFLRIQNTHMENGKKDEEGVNNESHNVGECSEGEGHFGDLRKL